MKLRIAFTLELRRSDPGTRGVEGSAGDVTATTKLADPYQGPSLGFKIPDADPDDG